MGKCIPNVGDSIRAQLWFLFWVSSCWKVQPQTSPGNLSSDALPSVNFLHCATIIEFVVPISCGLFVYVAVFVVGCSPPSYFYFSLLRIYIWYFRTPRTVHCLLTSALNKCSSYRILLSQALGIIATELKHMHFACLLDQCIYECGLLFLNCKQGFTS